MGNRQGAPKQKTVGKSKEEKKREKELKKEQEKLKKKKERISKKKKSGGLFASGLETDLDNSSHVTGGDSESSEFHSAENVSTNPYLDSCTRSELEQASGGHGGWGWGATAGAASSVSYYQLHHHNQQQQQGHLSSHHLRYHQAQQHPMVLSSRDFRDGFSLEACIPPEIARRDPSYSEETSRSSVRASQTTDSNKDRSGSSIKSKRSHSDSVKSKSSKSSKSSSIAAMTLPSSQHATPTSLRSYGGVEEASSMTSSQTSAGGGGDGAGYSTPLLSTPVFSRVDRAHSPSSTLTRLQEVEPFEFDDTSQQQQSHHHPHFLNHQRPFRKQEQKVTEQNHQSKDGHLQSQKQQQYQLTSPTDFRNLPKPTSPHPQRRALSPKMTSAPLKLISSDDSSSSPTTPVPQRRANILDIFRSGSRSDKSDKKTKTDKSSKAGEKYTREKHGGKSDSSSNTNESERGEAKSRAKWKTWERSSAKKKTADKQSKVSMIFGTIRKSDKNKEKGKADVANKAESKNGDPSLLEKGKVKSGTDSRRSIHESDACENKSNVFDSMSKSQMSHGNDLSKRNSSPPISKSTAFCIMKLEELERNIEKTIREKFPDAEPFLLKKRTKDEELKGSRSLPTTPSLKKKLYIAQHTNNGTDAGIGEVDTSNAIESNLRAVSSKLSEKGHTRWCDETFESLPSPTMSPVVLRRFGARTRHASISPKIQRAKTAALYNSPSELSRLDEACSAEGRTVTTKVPQYRAVSRGQEKPAPNLSPLIASSLACQTKSSSKYDNVNDESDDDSKQRKSRASSRMSRQRCVDEDDSDEVEESTLETYDNLQHNQNQKPVIVPTFSAVFGSVSPKLKHHLKSKFNDIQKSSPAGKLSLDKIQQRRQFGREARSIEEKQKMLGNLRTSSLDSPSSSSGKPSFQTQTLDNKTCLPSARNGDSGVVNVSVRDRVKSINKSLSEGWASGSTIISTNGNFRELMSSGREKTHQQSLSPPISRTSEHRDPISPLSPTFSPHLPWTSQVNQEFRHGSVTSPGSSRKHSIDHVVFGSAVALPCRLYAQPLSPPPCHEEHFVVNTYASSAHARNAPPSLPAPQQRDSVKNVKKQKVDSAEDRRELASLTSATNRSETSPTHIAIDGDSQDASACAPPGRDNVSSVFTQVECSDKQADDEVRLTSHSVPWNIHVGSASAKCETNVGSAQGETTSHTSDDVTQNGDSKTESPRSKQVDDNKNNDVSNNTPLLHRHELKKRGAKEYSPEFKEEEQEVIVFRQPISKVIYDMINTSKQKDQQPPQTKSQWAGKEQQKLHQSSPTSPEQETHVEHVVTMVTSQTYEQPCLTLEEKTVRSDSSKSLPSSPLCTTRRIERDFESHQISNADVYESKCTGSQTESVSTAEKGVESDDLPGYALISSKKKHLPDSQSNSISETSTEKSNVCEDNESSADSEIKNEFLRKVISLGKTRDIVVKGTLANKCNEDNETFVEKADAPPPPSPSAMDQLLEEFEDDDEDDEDVNGRREKETHILKDKEMQEFTESVVYRLSSILASHEGEYIDDEVFEEDDKIEKSTKGTEKALDSHRLSEELNEPCSSEGLESKTITCYKEGVVSKMTVSQTSEGLKRVLTIHSSSSSLTTTTESSEEADDADDDFLLTGGLKQSQCEEESKRDLEHSTNIQKHIESSEGAPKKKTGPNYFVFPEFNDDRRDVAVEDSQRRQSGSRDCHSDDDVARGQGIPDYYDDRPLWSRRQKPPGQLSLEMVAIRRRERRERWLKKRQRNRTDLLSTGSSDTGSETSLLRYEHPRLKDPSSAIDYSYYDQPAGSETEHLKAMGSGILSSPKYSKPIMPFFTGENSGNRENSPEPVQEDLVQAQVASGRLHAARPPRNFTDEDRHPWKTRHRDSFDHNTSSDEDYHRHRDRKPSRDQASKSDQNLAIPGIEETFNELESVKHILEELQDRTHVNRPVKESSKCVPLTAENVKSVNEYYKENNTTVSKSGRRSLVSMTDRTESDLDIYSEAHDDASTDSNVYADDEEDDDGADTYATAEDDLGAGATCSSENDTLGRRHKRRPHHGDDEDDGEDDTDFVVSCTFYNSNTQPSAADSGGGVTPVADTGSRSAVGSSGKATPQNTSGRGGVPSQASSVGASMLNSDDEFWTGSSAIEASYKQLETAADAVSSTFQNAREQMIDIQQHLQSLRRQMEGLEEDVSPSSNFVTPDFS